MKQTQLMVAVILTMLTSISSVGIAANEPIDAPIKRVTVYSDQARISRSAHLSFTAGDHTVVIEQIPTSAVELSFRASATGVKGITIMGLSHKQVEHLETPAERVAGLEKEIKHLERTQKQVLSDHLAAFTEQRGLMSSIGDRAGTQIATQVGKENLSVTRWDEAYQYVGRQLRIIDDSIRVVKNQLEDVDDQLALLQAQLSNANDPRVKSSQTVQIDLHLSDSGEVNVVLEYMVPGASWKPMYDARLIGDSGQVELSYVAEVTQHTGEDWKEVELTLSTALPSRGTGPGEFMPRYLSEYVPPDGNASLDKVIRVCADKDIINKFEVSNQTTMSQGSIKSRPVQTVDNLLRQVAGVDRNSEGQVIIRGARAGEVSYLVDGVPIGDPVGGYGGWSSEQKVPLPAIAEVSNADIRGGTSTASFTSHRKETVLSGNDAVRTTVARWTLAGQMQLVSRPRNLDGAWRIVTITNQAEVPLLPGRVAIFVESDFLGNAQLNQVIAPSQAFDLPFGLDSRLTVSRKLLSFKKSESRDKTRLDYTVQIAVVNHANVSCRVRIEDPFPVSRDSRVKIDFGEILPKMTSIDVAGRGVWLLQVKPGDSTLVSIPTKMEYPSGMQIVEK